MTCSQAGEKEAITCMTAPNAIGPYSQAIKAGQFIFVSGQIPIDSRTGEITGINIQEQTRQVLENINGILAAAHSSLNKVVKTTIYLTTLSDYAEVNAVYAAYFNDPFPARATIEVSSLPKNAKIEIDAVAVL